MEKFSKRLEFIANNYGIESQLLKLHEECAELGAAACKEIYLFASGADSKLCKKAARCRIYETADVLILASQVLYLLSLPENKRLAKSIKKSMEKKINRQLRRIEAEKKYRQKTCLH